MSSKLGAIHKDLSGVENPNKLFDSFFNILNDLNQVDGSSFSLISAAFKGNSAALKNPVVTLTDGLYTLNGSAVFKFADKSLANLLSANFNFSGASAVTENGKLQINAQIIGTLSPSKDLLGINVSGVSFLGTDGSKWSVGGISNYKHSINYVTSDVTESKVIKITSFSSTDSSGNSYTFSGKFDAGPAADSISGYMTQFDLKIGSTKISASGLKISYDALKVFNFTTFGNSLDMLLVGNDVITLLSSDLPEDFVLNGMTGNDTLVGSFTDDVILGGQGNDVINGGTGNDRLYGGDTDNSPSSGSDTILGGDGDDFIFGGDGNDILNGGSGNDTISGGLGSDVIVGGAGDDVFVLNKSDYDFTSLKTVLIDTIVDFKRVSNGQNDSISLVGFDRYIAVKNLADAKAIGVTAQVIYESSTGKFWYNDDSDPALDGALVFAKAIGIPFSNGEAYGINVM